MTLDDTGTPFCLSPAEDGTSALIGEEKKHKKYVGEISKNLFFIRRPIIEGAKSVGVGISGRVLPSIDGCRIAVFCEPSPAQNMFISISEIQFAAVLVMTLIVPLATSMSMTAIVQNFLASMVLSFPLFLGGLFLKTYFREYLVPDRELYEHVFSIAQDARQMPESETES